jgi:hypothetical protein
LVESTLASSGVTTSLVVTSGAATRTLAVYSGGVHWIRPAAACTSPAGRRESDHPAGLCVPARTVSSTRRTDTGTRRDLATHAASAPRAGRPAGPPAARDARGTGDIDRAVPGAPPHHDALRLGERFDAAR